MANTYLDAINDYVDISTINVYNIVKHLVGEKKALKMANYASRDNGRTPVQWSAEKNAGFTTAEKPWFKINPNYTEINAASQEDDPDSVLNFYRRLLKFRKENDIVIYGSYEEHDHANKNLFTYSRELDGKRMLVVCSFSENTVAFKAPEGFALADGALAISNYKKCGIANNGCVLRPYETRVYLWN